MAAPAHAQVWTRYSVTRNGKELKLRIQELPKENFEDLFEFLFKCYVPDEPLHKASKIAQSAEALDEYKQGFIMMNEKTKYQVDACYLDEESELQMVGVSIMVLEKEGEPCDDMETVKAMAQSGEIRTLLDLSTYMDNKCNVFRSKGLGLESITFSQCYKGRGVAVLEDYRGLGIAGQLLQVRAMVCRERGVPITSAWMTSVATQKAAAKLGWDTIYELQYEELGKCAGVAFEGAPPTCKLMILKI